MAEDGSVRTVAVAAAANVLIAAAKGVAAIVTGSAALAAETAHSVADTCNEVLLAVGVRAAARPADERHPFGHGQARYFWALLAAVGIFVVGGVFAIVEGVNTLRHPEPVTDVAVGIVVLLVSMALETLSWRTAHRQLRAEADARHLDIWRYLRIASDPTATTVYLEDSAALVGLTLALIALVLHAVTGSAVWDGVSSLLIGALLVVVAYLLIRRNRGLLIDESPPADVLAKLRAAVAQEAWVVDVPRLTAVWVGPGQLLLIAHVVPVTTDDLPEQIGRLRARLLAIPAITVAEITPVEATHH